ncbi:anti-sigma factor [Ramlibacter sp. USB13]|uniref:Anti-sigma factor n=1 Tax=Ramlibacter cellulosilyticus TaxID=2764187 RepID=A0A923MLX5_9BURK|nr:anti-sigma factor [Ramlibacter cellulosilyticus]MBC5781440.1 anti-sigma factor [Ramlibacter cellulosilyticus]
MNWYRNPSAIEQLAAAYVAGTLRGRARRRFEAAMQTTPALVDEVNDWTRRLAPLHRALPEQAPSDALWTRIEKATTRRDAPAPKPSWWRRLLAPAPAGALAVGLLVGSLVPVLWQAQVGSRRDMELPDSYVGVLATAQGQPGLIVSSLRQGRKVDIKQLTPVPVPAGRTLYLWRIDKAGAVAPVGPLPQGKFTHVTLDAPAEQVFFPAVELAVSIEAAGARPAAPSSPFVYRGLCGKLWR